MTRLRSGSTTTWTTSNATIAATIRRRRVFALWPLLISLIGVGACSDADSGTPAAGVGLPDSASSGASSSGASSGASSSGAGDAGASSSSGADGSGDGASSGGVIEAEKCLAKGKGDCDENSECSSDLYCDPCKRKCLTPRKVCEPCTTDAQCDKAESGSACMTFKSGGTFCGGACYEDVGCPPTHKCAEIPGLTGLQKKQCVPKTGSCAEGSGACKKDTDCPYTMICNADYGTCIKGCGADAECPSAKVCSLFRCSDPCTADAECTKLAPEAKCVAKKCTIPGGCLGPADCPEKETFCDGEAHKCKPGCVVDSDCKDFAKKCSSGKCEAKGCTANWECAFEEVCDITAGKCVKAEGKFCAKCDAQDEKAVACDGAPHKCFAFQDKDGNKLGDFCAIACSDAKVGPCPQGYQCQEVPDQDGNPIGNFCLRQCWQSPFPDEK